MIKILVYGAGVIGSIFAYKLKTGENEVTILSRGKRLEQLKKHGLILRDDIIHETFKTEIDVTDKLNPEDYYDLVLVIMQRQQVSSILPILKKNTKIPTVLFVGNNVNGADEYLQAISKDRILLGFGGPGGYREDNIVVIAYMDKAILYVGELDGTISERILNIEKIFVDSGITVDISENIDAWLKTHMALIAPLAMASYTAQKQNKRFGEVEELIKLSLVAFRENMKALKKLGIPILPKKFKVLGWIPKFIIIKKLRDLLNSDFGRIALSGHADSAHDEMKRLVEDFRELVKDVRTNLDANSTLYKLSFA